MSVICLRASSQVQRRGGPKLLRRKEPAARPRRHSFNETGYGRANCHVLLDLLLSKVNDSSRRRLGPILSTSAGESAETK